MTSLGLYPPVASLLQAVDGDVLGVVPQFRGHLQAVDPDVLGLR